MPYAWHAHPDVWALMAALLGGYFWALRRLGPRHTAPGQPVATRLQQVCWVSGVVTLWVAADWPIGSDWPRLSTWSDTTPTSVLRTGRAISSCCPRDTIPAA